MSLPRKISSVLIVNKDLLMKRPGETFLGESYELGFIVRKVDPGVQLVSGYHVGTLVASVASQKLVKRRAHVVTRHDIDVREEHIVRLAILPGKVPHVILRIDVAGAPVDLLVRYVIREFAQGCLGFGTVHTTRQTERPSLLLRRSSLGHHQGKRHARHLALVAVAQVRQVLLQSLEFLVAGGVQSHGHGTTPMVHHLDEREQFFHGTLRC